MGTSFQVRLLLAILMILVLSGPIHAARASAVPCSASALIAAIAAANAAPTDDVIDLPADCAIILAQVHNNTKGANGLPVIADEALSGRLTINGNGAKLLRGYHFWLPMMSRPGAASASSAVSLPPAPGAPAIPDFRFLYVASGGNLTLNQVTLQGGYLPALNGGGIYNAGTLILNDSTVSGSTAGGGGGISNEGTLLISSSTISGNAALYGGGIQNPDSGSLMITNSKIIDNTSANDGAGMNSSGSLTVTTSLFSGNNARGLGGGIAVVGGTAAVTNTTFRGNSAHQMASGGGMLVVNSTVSISGCTFTGNYGAFIGGGLFAGTNKNLTIDNSTFANNTAEYQGGGIWNNGNLTITRSTISGNASGKDGGGLEITGGTLNVGGTIVARNASPTGPDIYGAVNSLGYNVITSTTGATINGVLTGNLTDVGAAPLNLGPLQDNGGPTQTMALSPGSVAINAGDPAFAPPPGVDQRGPGFPRVAGGRIDIGAYESP